MSDKELENLIYKHTLLNAIKHDGKAEVGPVISKVLGERPELKKNAKEIAELVKRIVNQVNSMTIEDQLRELREKFPEELREEKREVKEEKKLPPLPNVKGKVVTRFAPNPDGPLHLGNARAAVLSFEYAQMYNGDFILRFDDTDPKIKKPLLPAYEWIKQDLNWLGISWKTEFKASSRIERYYEIAKTLISKGFAYVDTCGEEVFKKFKAAAGKAKEPECLHRSSPPEVNLELWEKMLNREFNEGQAVVRIKTDLSLPDPSQRDWVMLRIINTEKNPHPIVGDKYWVWPTYNFASPIDDHDFFVTHVLRAKEHMSNTEKQRWIYKYLGWEEPTVIQFGRLKLEGFMMSKSKIKGLIEKGIGTIDDPRLPTLAGLRRRGILPETIKEIIISVGIKVSDATISYQNIAAENRKKLDIIAKRLMFVTEDAQKFKLNIPEKITAKIPYHPTKDLGFRTISVEPGDYVYLNKEDVKEGEVLRLMECCNVKVKGDQLDFISRDINDARKLNAKIVQWVKVKEAVDTVVIKPNNDNSELLEIKGYSEHAISELSIGEIIQFVRFGFVRIDNKNDERTITTVFAHD